MYSIIKRGIFRVKNVTREFVIVESELYQPDSQCLIHENETRSFFKSSGTSNRSLSEYEIMKCSRKMRDDSDPICESLGPFAGMWFPFYGISTSINSEGGEEDWIVKSTKVKDYMNYSKKIEKIIMLGPILSHKSRAKFKIMVSSYFICYTDLCLSAWLGDGLWETEFKPLRDILIRDIEMIDLSGEEEDVEDLTEMTKSELNDHFKHVYNVSLLEDAREKIKELNIPHYESVAKSRAKSRIFFNEHNSAMDAIDNILLKRSLKTQRKHVFTQMSAADQRKRLRKVTRKKSSGKESSKKESSKKESSKKESSKKESSKKDSSKKDSSGKGRKRKGRKKEQ